MRAEPLRVIAGYLALSIGLTWPLVGGLPGFPNVDAVDTAMLRGLVAERLLDPQSLGIYFPAGYPVLDLTPNLADHILGAPLVWWLPFPLSDSLWWLGALCFVGAAAHHLGRQLGGSHGAGALAGVGLVTAEALAREANLGHAPQVLAAGFAPLYLAALLRALSPGGRRRDAVAAGVWLAAAAVSYWYQGLFLAAASLPLIAEVWLRRAGDRAIAARLGVVAGTCGALSAAPLAWTLGRVGALPKAGLGGPSTDDGPIPAALRIALEHGGDPGLLLHFTPVDRSNGLALSLALAAVAALVVSRRAGRPWPWGLLAVAALGWVMALGPFLKWGEQPVLVGGQPLSLPFRWLGELHPFLARLSWPERWGILIPLGLVAAAARAPRPAAWALLIGLEALVRSHSVPLAHTDLSYEQPWAALSAAEGAVLELPLARGWRTGSLPGRHARWHGRPVANPVLLPPGHRAPAAWLRWVKSAAVPVAVQAMESGEAPPPLSPADAAALRADGVGVVALDLLAHGVTEGRARRYKALLSPAMGEPEDRGALLVWWLAPAVDAPAALADPERWRATLRRDLKDNPPPAVDSLIQTLWLTP